MKDIMGIIRLNKVNVTKKALAEAGFPSITFRKVLGRGKKSLDQLSQDIIDENLGTTFGFSQGTRLVAKRFFNLIVKDEDVQEIVKIIIEANKTDTPGDGKIFIMPIEDVYRIRDGKNGEEVV